MVTRPTYENAASLKDEVEVIRLIESKWKCKAQKLPKAYEIDFALWRDDKLAALAEVKCRKNTIDKYETFFISLHKIYAGQKWGSFLGVPFILVVRFSDCFAYIINPTTEHYEAGGRFDRGDSQDCEIMAHFSAGAFVIMKGKA